MGRFFRLLLLACILMTSATVAQETPEQQIITVRVWWPDALYNKDNTQATNLLESQIDDFDDAQSLINVDFRLKRSEGQGSIISTLIAAEEVAPGAIPDLVLLRRDDLAEAVKSGIVKPIENWLPDVIRDDLLPNTAALGQIDGILYGLPYALRVDHLAYRSSLIETAPVAYEDVLASEQSFLLSGAPLPNQAVNNLVLAQYLALGGRLVDDNDAPILAEEPLLQVLRFYEEGVAKQIFSLDILNYDLPTDYWSRFEQGGSALAVVSSTDYLQRNSQNITVAPIPTNDGKPLTTVDGWMWALTTGNPEHQDAALEFLRWMMRADQQAEYTEALGVLPSLTPALRIWSNSAYTEQIAAWLPQSLIFPLGQRNNQAAVQLQAAFVAVMNGTPAEEAIEEALNNLAGD